MFSTVPTNATNITTKYMIPGESIAITKAKWKNSNVKVARVISKKRVFARKGGKATLTATIKKKKTQVNIVVLAPVSSAVTMSNGNTYQIKTNGVSYKKFKWTSKNKNIVSVSKTGKVTAKKVGTTKVTGTFKKKTITVNFTVVKKNTSTPTPVDVPIVYPDTKKTTEEKKKTTEEKKTDPVILVVTPTTTTETPEVTTTEAPKPIEIPTPSTNPYNKYSTKSIDYTVEKQTIEPVWEDGIPGAYIFDGSLPYGYKVTTKTTTSTESIDEWQAYFKYAAYYNLNQDDPDVVEYKKHINIYTPEHIKMNYGDAKSPDNNALYLANKAVLNSSNDWRWEISDNSDKFRWFDINALDYPHKVSQDITTKTIDGITFNLSDFPKEVVYTISPDYYDFTEAFRNNYSEEITNNRSNHKMIGNLYAGLDISSDKDMDKDKIKVVINNGNVLSYRTEYGIKSENIDDRSNYSSKYFASTFDCNTVDYLVPNFTNRIVAIRDYNKATNNTNNKIYGLGIQFLNHLGEVPVQLYYNNELLCECNIKVQSICKYEKEADDLYQEIKTFATNISGENATHTKIMSNMAAYIYNQYHYLLEQHTDKYTYFTGLDCTCCWIIHYYCMENGIECYERNGNSDTLLYSAFGGYYHQGQGGAHTSLVLTINNEKWVVNVQGHLLEDGLDPLKEGDHGYKTYNKKHDRFIKDTENDQGVRWMNDPTKELE